MIGFVAESAGDVRDVLAVLVASMASEAGKQGFEDPRILADAVLEGSPTAFVDLHGAFVEARARGLRLHGLKKDLGQRAARAALLLLAERQPELGLTTVVLAQDADRDPRRRPSLETVRQGSEWPFDIAIGVANPEVEAWVLVSFEPEDHSELAALHALKSELGFDPRRSPERLDSTGRGSPRDPKRLVARLNIDTERARQCLQRPAHELRERSGASGLAEFLDDVVAHVIPKL